MNTLQPTPYTDTRMKAGSGVPAARHPALEMTETFLELTLPTGWMLGNGTRCQLDVVRGCLWLTDTRGKDLWLKDGDSELLITNTLLTAECETVIQLSQVARHNRFWRPRLQVNAKYQRMQLHITALSLWQRFTNLIEML